MIEDHADEIDESHNFNDNEKNEEFQRVLDELEGKRRQCLSEQQRVTELEEQLHVISKYEITLAFHSLQNIFSTNIFVDWTFSLNKKNSKILVQDNNALQSRLADATTQEEIKSMHDELSILDEVR